MNKKHYKYLDALREIAMLAVVVDHTWQLAYSSEIILNLSSFLVTLFIFLAGITAFLSMDAKGIQGYDISYVKKRVKAVLVPYLISTAFCIFTNGWWHFDFKEYVKAVILFNGEPAFYFVFFFLQLILVSPVLYLAVKVIFAKKKYHLLINTIIVALIVWIAYFCTEYTTMLDLHGAGYYLLGSSFLIVYFLGMICGVLLLNGNSLKAVNVIGTISAAGLVLYVAGVFLGYLTRNNYSLIYNKWSVNPPGFILCMYG